MNIENEIKEFINFNNNVTDTDLKKKFEDVDDLYFYIDSLILDNWIERIYPKDSQIAFYKLSH